MTTTAFTLPDLDVHQAERLLCTEALKRAGSIVEAAQLLGLTRHALKRRITKHRIDWPPAVTAVTVVPDEER